LKNDKNPVKLTGMTTKEVAEKYGVAGITILAIG